MGLIRGRHVSPGIYTKYTPIKLKGDEHNGPLSTANANEGGGDGSFRPIFFYGYIPIVTESGLVTDECISWLTELTGDEIKNMDTISEFKTSKKEFDLNKGFDIPIPSDIPLGELLEMMESGQSYYSIADEHNSCVVLMIPRQTYEREAFNVIDGTFSRPLKDAFVKINDIVIDRRNYVLLCMFNNRWSYSRIGKDKLISHLGLVVAN